MAYVLVAFFCFLSFFFLFFFFCNHAFIVLGAKSPPWRSRGPPHTGGWARRVTLPVYGTGRGRALPRGG